MQPDDTTVWIPLRARDGSVRAYALIDAADADFVNQWRWCLRDGAGYVIRGTYVGGVQKTHYLHRELLGLVPGDGLEVDHINHDKLDNRRANLRPGTRSDNQQNRSGNVVATSRHRGVSRAPGGKWQAHIKIAGKGKNLGTFTDEESAAAAAREARRRLMPRAND